MDRHETTVASSNVMRKIATALSPYTPIRTRASLTETLLCECGEAGASEYGGMQIEKTQYANTEYIVTGDEGQLLSRTPYFRLTLYI